jgi:hypothetical protein
MITVYTYKLQGNGQDSWHVDVHDVESEAQASPANRVSRHIAFQDPESYTTNNTIRIIYIIW